MSETDPFPDAPSYAELEEMHVDMSECEDIVEFSEKNRDWYNEAVPVAARLIVEVAREHDEYRQQVLDSDELGVGHEMQPYDAKRYTKLNEMGLSASQGGSAENLARTTLEEEFVE